MKKTYIFINIIFSFLLILVFLNSGCKSNEKQQAPPPPKVTVSKPLVREVVEWDEYVGRLEATDSVEVRARVSGYLESIHFDEGEIVDKGQLLFVIDPRPYRAALNRAEGNLEQSRARLDLARSNYERAKKLLDKKIISQEVFDTRSTGLEEARASLQSAQAAVEEAKLNLEFTEVKSPIRGRISREFVTEGNLVNGGNDGTLLTTIVSLDPIHCYFETDERSVLKYMRLSRNGSRLGSGEAATPVYLSLSDEQGFPHKGKMDFIDNRIDPDTGTMTGRAIFPNPDQLLVPGMFARVRVQGSERYKAIQIPEEAIGTDQSQKYVLMVNDKNIVEYKRVELGPVIDGMRVIKEGLGPDDLVVISGLQRARPDSRVEPVMDQITIDERSDTSVSGAEISPKEETGESR